MRVALILAVLLMLGVKKPEPWTLVLAAGSNEQGVFDNARDAVKTALLATAPLGSVTREYTSNYAEAGKPHLTIASVQQLANGLTGNTGKCLLYVTSHGSHDQGLVVNREFMTAELLDAILTETCKGPTVVIISACYSGRFVAPVMQKPNRIILTAASADRSSFGCSNDLKYTYWDGCFLKALPTSTKWSQVYAKTSECVTFLENQVNRNFKEQGSEDHLEPSLPQFFEGARASDNILN